MRNHIYNIWKAVFCNSQCAKQPKKTSEADYQRLVENLRERVHDAEQRIEEAERHHRQEIADLHAAYKMQVKDLTERLQLTRLALEQKSRQVEDNFNFE